MKLQTAVEKVVATVDPNAPSEFPDPNPWLTTDIHIRWLACSEELQEQFKVSETKDAVTAAISGDDVAKVMTPYCAQFFAYGLESFTNEELKERLNLDEDTMLEMLGDVDDVKRQHAITSRIVAKVDARLTIEEREAMRFVAYNTLYGIQTLWSAIETEVGEGTDATEEQINWLFKGVCQAMFSMGYQTAKEMAEHADITKTFGGEFL